MYVPVGQSGVRAETVSESSDCGAHCAKLKQGEQESEREKKKISLATSVNYIS